jgi:hypothetical protein
MKASSHAQTDRGPTTAQMVAQWALQSDWRDRQVRLRLNASSSDDNPRKTRTTTLSGSEFILIVRTKVSANVHY